MRRTVQIAGQVENLFGTLDENLKLLESALQVTTDLRDNRLAIEGEPEQVERAVGILNQYNELVREGRRLDNGAVKSLLRIATQVPEASLRNILEPGEPGRPRIFGKIATVLQMIVVIWILLDWDRDLNARWLGVWTISAAMFTGLSGLLYVWDAVNQLGAHPASSATKS